VGVEKARSVVAEGSLSAGQRVDAFVERKAPSLMRGKIYRKIFWLPSALSVQVRCFPSGENLPEVVSHLSVVSHVIFFVVDIE